MAASPKSKPRRVRTEPLLRDAVRTRNAILAAARECFGADSYDRVTTRRIAATAGVNHSLISNYFGSKEGLFRELVADVHHMDGALALEVEIDRIVDSVAEPEPDSARRIMFRSSNSPQAASIFRDFLERRYVPSLAAQITGPDATLRVELALSLIHGAIVFRRLGLSGLTTADVADLKTHLKAALWQILGSSVRNTEPPVAESSPTEVN